MRDYNSLFDTYLRNNSELQIRSMLPPLGSYKPTTKQIPELLARYPEFARLFTDQEILDAVPSIWNERSVLHATVSAIRDKSIIASSRLLLDRTARTISCRYPGKWLSLLIKAGFPYQTESVRLALMICPSQYLMWLLVPSYQHDACPRRIQCITKLLYTMRCVPDCIIGALSPELIEHVMYFVR